jgi:hypothetical protein
MKKSVSCAQKLLLSAIFSGFCMTALAGPSSIKYTKGVDIPSNGSGYLAIDPSKGLLYLDGGSNRIEVHSASGDHALLNTIERPDNSPVYGMAVDGNDGLYAISEKEVEAFSNNKLAGQFPVVNGDVDVFIGSISAADVNGSFYAFGWDNIYMAKMKNKPGGLVFSRVPYECKRPFSTAVDDTDPSNVKVYDASYLSRLCVFTPKDGQSKLFRIDGLGMSVGMAFDRESLTLYVTDTDDNSFAEVKEGKVVFKTYCPPCQRNTVLLFPALDPSTGTLYVLMADIQNYDASVLLVFRQRQLQEVIPVDDGRMFDGRVPLAVDPSRHTVYVRAHGGGSGPALASYTQSGFAPVAIKEVKIDSTNGRLIVSGSGEPGVDLDVAVSGTASGDLIEHLRVGVDGAWRVEHPIVSNPKGSMHTVTATQLPGVDGTSVSTRKVRY